MVASLQLFRSNTHFLHDCLSFYPFLLVFLILIKIQTAHSAFPDSPLGPDAYHEYESLLVQDYEELVKKSWTKPGQAKHNFED